MPTLCAGVASIDITPPVGVALAGGAFGASTGVLHPLSAQALFLTDGFTGVLLLSADVIGFGTAYADAVRAAAARRCGVPAARVMLAATHTHSGPATAASNGGAPGEDYRRRLQKQLVELAAQASASPRPVEIAAGYGTCAGITVNRAVEGGPVDEQVCVVRLDAPDGRPLAALVNYACRPVTLQGYQGLISPDFPHLVRARIREALNPEMEVLYLTGAAGDLDPAGAESALAAFRRTGNTLGAAALQALSNAQPDRSGALAAAECSLQALRLGPAAVVGLPGELFHASGKQIKAASPFPVTLISTQTNGSKGCIPGHSLSCETAALLARLNE